MMMTRIGVALVLASGLLFGCASISTGDASLPYFLPIGAGVVLQQDLIVPAGNSRVFLQHGQTVAKTSLDIYQPHCNFEQRRVSEGHAVIAADHFTVTAVREGEDMIVQRRAYVYASLSLASDDHGVSQVNRYFHFILSTKQQPEVMRLTCHGGFNLPGLAQLPTLAEIHKALGLMVLIEQP
ncbi:MAG: hypothetical protein WCX90_09955 [Thiohalomonadaceae bacterium]